MYEMILIAADGLDTVRDFQATDPDECGELWANSGSRWFFYPYGVVVKVSDTPMLRKRIIRTPMFGPLANVTGSVKRMMDTIRENADELHQFYFGQ